MKLKKIDATGKPYRIFAEHLESEAIDQFTGAMQQDSVLRGALMPDAHAGYTLPIGAVVAVEGMVYPSFVGYDIGCGMCAVKTTFQATDVRNRADRIFRRIYELLPVGFEHRKTPMAWDDYRRLDQTPVLKKLMENGGLKQLGTLGSGNHFVEVGEDASGEMWIVIHSGSRNIGHSVATHYLKVASPDGRPREGFYGLRTDSAAGEDYIRDMTYCLAFALENRRQIMGVVAEAIGSQIGGQVLGSTLINRNHNHAEKKDGLWIHRKGATHAEDGMDGVIPGNMRDGSFIVRGKGNPESLFSSSHGAGRVMGRKEAKKKIDLPRFAAAMKERGITARVDLHTLDEAPDAYKDIWEVMAMQTDLVEVLHHVRPIINIKG